MSQFLPNVNTLRDFEIRALAETANDGHVRNVLLTAREITGAQLRTLEGVELYRAQGAAAALIELETLLDEAKGLLLRR